MQSIDYFVGIDIADKTFAAAIYASADAPLQVCDGFENNIDGFLGFCAWLRRYEVDGSRAIICIEATGVYGEALCYYLYEKGYHPWLESPDKVKHAFKIKGHKTDAADAAQIAEYACRYLDRCRLWAPSPEAIEHLGTLLSAREQLIGQRTATKNALKAYQRKVVSTELVLNSFQDLIKTLSEQIQGMEDKIKALIFEDSNYRRIYHILNSIPGIAMLTAANVIVVTKGGKQLTEYTKFAAYLGICPYQHTSGSSVKKQAKSSQLGPNRLRKLLHLAAKTVAHRCKIQTYKTYYQRKLAQGKKPKLIYNNIANKLLRTMCKLMKTQQYYDNNYISVNPNV